MVLLVPAYDPDGRLVDLVAEVRALAPGTPVVVVDDGSGPDSASVLAAVRALGATVLRHPANRGKGTALRTGFRYVHEHLPGEVVVCADADGQHRPDDVLRVAAAVTGPATVVLGARGLSGEVPLRSRLGNAATRRLFRLATGRALLDTQTGLRAWSPDLLPWLLRVPGDRYEYELEQLLRAQEAGVDVREVPIATVYLDDNASSHFRPVRDGALVYRRLARFAGSGVAAAAVDWVLVLALSSLTGSLVAAVVGARVVSAAVNYATNRRLVFRDAGDGSRRAAARRYVAVALALVTANWALMHGLVVLLGWPVLGAKLVTEALLVAVSYLLQRRWVFGAARPAGSVADEDARLVPAR